MNLLHALLFCMVSFLCVSEDASWPDFCCLKINPDKKLYVKNVIDCNVQSAGLCPIDAISIKTRKGRTVCYDLKDEWVIKHVVMNGSDSCVVKRIKHNQNNKKAGKGRRGGKRKRKQGKGSLN